MRRLLLLALLAVFALASCGTSGGNDAATTTTTAADEETTTTEATDEEPTTTLDEDAAGLTEEDYVGAFTEQLTSGAGGNLALDPDQGECVAVAWVDAIGVDALQESGATLDDLADPDYDISTEVDIAPETGDAVAQAFPDCGADLIAEFAALIAEDDEAEQCLLDAVDPAEFYDLLGDTFGGGDRDALDTLLGDAAASCGIEP